MLSESITHKAVLFLRNKSEACLLYEFFKRVGRWHKGMNGFLLAVPFNNQEIVCMRLFFVHCEAERGT